MKEYVVSKKSPVMKFYYQGSHSHPVRRTVLRINNRSSSTRYIVGYELREGSEVRMPSKAPVKTYLRSKIARIGQCGRRLRKRTPKNLHTNVTLRRLRLLDLVKEGA